MRRVLLSHRVQARGQGAGVGEAEVGVKGAGAQRGALHGAAAEGDGLVGGGAAAAAVQEAKEIAEES